MVVKAGELVTDALEEIIVQSDEAPIEQSEGRAAIRALNDMMMSYEARGINLGYTVVTSLADDITVPLGAVRWMKLQLAIEMAPRYNATVDNVLLMKVKDAYQAALNLSYDSIQSEYPSTLPIGSGNDSQGISSGHFYPDMESTILTETGGSIALEDDTE